MVLYLQTIVKQTKINVRMREKFILKVIFIGNGNAM